MIHNTPAAYLILAETYELMMDMLDDYELAKLVESCRADLSEAVEVDIDNLYAHVPAGSSKGVE